MRACLSPCMVVTKFHGVRCSI